MAKTAQQVATLLPPLSKLVDLLSYWREPSASDLRRLLTDGARHAEFLYGDAHGDRSARALIPSVKETMSWLSAAQSSLVLLSSGDPEWVKWWTSHGSPAAQPSFTKYLGEPTIHLPSGVGEAPQLPWRSDRPRTLADSCGWFVKDGKTKAHLCQPEKSSYGNQMWRPLCGKGPYFAGDGGVIDASVAGRMRRCEVCLSRGAQSQ